MHCSFLRTFALAALLITASLSSHAAVLLNVDYSNLSAVTFTATSGTPAYSYHNFGDTPEYPGGASDFKGEDGLTLMNFLTSNYGMSGDVGSGATASDLRDQPGTSILDFLYVMNMTVPANPLTDLFTGLNIYASSTTDQIFFANGQTALLGQAVFDFTEPAYASLVTKLPGLGASGGLVMWNTYDYPIGTWQVTGVYSAIPEPSTYAALIGGLALVGVILRRRSKAA